MKKLYYLLIIALLHVFSDTILAQPLVSTDQNVEIGDSLISYSSMDADAGYVSTTKKIRSIRSAAKLLMQAEKLHDRNDEATALLGMGDAYISFGNSRKALQHLTRSLKIKDAFKDEKNISHLYYDLAVILARLKQYPSALKCFYKTAYVYQQTTFGNKRRLTFSIDTTAVSNKAAYYADRAVMEEPAASDLFSDSLVDATVIHMDTALMENSYRNDLSPRIENEAICKAFEDGKPAVAYGLLVYIKQPLSGKRNIFIKLSKVGHTFITLIKFNKDSSIVSSTFGFYPKKRNLLSATPLNPSSPSVFKDDALHDWDEMIGKFISLKQFERIIDFIKGSRNKLYNLNHYNCTDFGLGIADIANINIEGTHGSWPMGHGNNPASTGQSILAGKFKNTDSNNKHGLLVCTNNLFAF